MASARAIIKRAAKSILIAVMAVIVAAALVSAFFDIDVLDARCKYEACVHNGNVAVVCRDVDHWAWPRRPLEWWSSRHDAAFSLSRPSWRDVKGSYLVDHAASRVHEWWVIIPLWLPFTAAAFAFRWMIWRDHGRRRGCCRRCGYDLRGAPGPRCPECGSAFDPVRELAARGVLQSSPDSGQYLPVP